MKLSEIANTLRDIRVDPVKTLGQNFLHDQNLARWIVDEAGLKPGDDVVEIGPGLGALTEWLLATGAHVLTIEKDGRLADFLREHFAGAALGVVHLDALEFDVRTLFPKRTPVLFSNLPYNVASQLIFRFLENPSPITLALFLLQKEMARRLAAVPGSADYGAMSLLVQARWRVELLRSVPATVFLPQPDVESAFVRLTPRLPGELPAHDAQVFKKIVRLGFSQRRKQLQKLLRGTQIDWAAAADAVGCDRQARAEELSLEQWISLANLASPPGTDSPAAKPEERFPVVDENDRVIGDETRSRVHANNLRHRAVHMLIFNRVGELFLQKRSPLKDRHPSVWDSSAAGHVDAGEEYDDAARRELREELGVAADLQRVLKLPATEMTGEEFVWLYRGEHDGPFSLCPTEIECGLFFPPRIVTEWVAAKPAEFAPGFIECWRLFRQHESERAPFA